MVDLSLSLSLTHIFTHTHTLSPPPGNDFDDEAEIHSDSYEPLDLSARQRSLGEKGPASGSHALLHSASAISDHSEHDSSARHAAVREGVGLEDCVWKVGCEG